MSGSRYSVTTLASLISALKRSFSYELDQVFDARLLGIEAGLLDAVRVDVDADACARRSPWPR